MPYRQICKSVFRTLGFSFRLRYYVDVDRRPYGGRERRETHVQQIRRNAQMKDAEGVTEWLKAENQMEWVGRMNSIRSRAEEVVLSELVYC